MLSVDILPEGAVVRLSLKIGAGVAVAVAAAVVGGYALTAGHLWHDVSHGSQDKASQHLQRSTARADGGTGRLGSAHPGPGSNGHSVEPSSTDAAGTDIVAPGPKPTATLSMLPAVTYTASGGLAGTVTVVTIERNAHWTRTVNDSVSARGTLDASQRRTLAALLRDSDLRTDTRAKQDGGGGLNGGQCADQITRTIKAGGFTVRAGCNTVAGPTFVSTEKAIDSYTAG